MGIEERLLVGKILLAQLEKEVALLSPQNGDLAKIIKKAQSTKAQMYLFYLKQDEKSFELLEQIRQMDSIIKKVEELHNKHVT
jgi:hypothetical protein